MLSNLFSKSKTILQSDSNKNSKIQKKGSLNNINIEEE